MVSQEESIINDPNTASGRKEFDEDGSLLKSLEQRLSSPRGPEKEDQRLQSQNMVYSDNNIMVADYQNSSPPQMMKGSQKLQEGQTP